ncbi:MAG: ABC transporter ATP-binding protein [Armatimonadetes bacterium]|nr:ABC transporter ATP-binding protein [Armatimonadota bacterium]
MESTQTLPRTATHLPHTASAHDAHPHPTPTQRLWQFLSAEKSDLWTLTTYTVVAGLLALVVPLTAQVLVNTIAANVLIQPLVVLSVLVLVGMILSGVLQLMRLTVAEILQQRVFARTALEMATRLPRLQSASLRGEYAPELANRFFDTLTVQKALSKLLIDGMAAVLQAVVGLVLLGFYSPYLLGLDIAILLFLAFVIGVLGMGGVASSLKESKEKYHVADWLEDMARCHTEMKLHGAPGYLTERADNAVMRYLLARRAHFRVIWRQSVGNYVFQAVASAAVLAIGGWLVINRELTLGQLVASQIVVVSLLAAIDKMLRQAEQVFDLITGLEKVGHVLDMPTERTGGVRVPDEPATLSVREVRFSYAPGVLPDTLTGLNLQLAAGERASLVGASGTGKSTLSALIAGLETPNYGEITVNGIDVRDADLADLRRVLSLINTDDAIFDGTIEENVTVGREGISHSDVREALEIVQLAPEIATFPQGVSTMLVSGGQPLSRGQRQRLMLARTLAGRPRLLILDEAFNGMDEAMIDRVLDGLYASERTWTILAITHTAQVVLRSQTIHVLDNGTITESGTLLQMRARNGRFAQLFPSLMRQLGTKGAAK